ncbi:MAG TPA: cytochrome P450 [Anaerolineae bacterium]|nr:cytochrome P450 [Anaerolineae bacterium]
MVISQAITPKIAPGPQEFPDLWQNPLQTLVDAARQYGDVVCLDPTNHRIYLVTHPDHIKQVLQDNYRNYRRDADSFKLLAGNGLIVSEGDFWLRQRRLMQPAFHRQQIAALTATMTEVTVAMLERWRAAAEQGEPLDILAEMMNLTLTVIVKTMFGGNVDEEVEAAANALGIGQEYLYQQGWDYTGEQGTAGEEQFRQAIDTLDRMVYRLINERRRSGQDGHDLLSMLLQARDEETGEGMSEQQLRDEIVTIFGAGRDTTAIGLAWTWYLLDRHPEVERRLQAELARVLAGRAPTFADLPNLPYTRQLFEEALRLYPPGWMTARLSLGEDEIGGYHIPAHSEIFLSPYVTQRRPDLWPDPEAFDPDRFNPECAANRPRFAYFPFGGGPRVCIGNAFAMVEAQLVIAMIAQTYHLRLFPGCQVEPEALITLQPKNLWMTLTRET